MLGFIWWIIVGLVAGLLARMLMPGRQPMGWLLTIVLGLIGSVAERLDAARWPPISVWPRPVQGAHCNQARTRFDSFN